MDIITVVGSVVSSVVASGTAAWWLSKQLVSHRLRKELEAYKAEIRQRVESYLAEAAADREYKSEAKRRLYLAIGPLRFQLLMAARDLLRRMNRHHLDDWDMTPEEYYARSFMYRILRPLALGELVERQMSFADFSVDPTGITLLRFQTAAYRMLTGEDAVLGHPKLNWTDESEVIFRDNLRFAALGLVFRDDEGNYCILDFSQFSERYAELARTTPLASLAAIFARCHDRLTENPVFWARLVGYSYVCEWMVDQLGADLGFGKREMNIEEMLRATTDAYITSHADARPSFNKTITEAL